MKEKLHYVGIDVSKESFDVAFESEGTYRFFKFSNTPAGFRKLIKVLPLHAHCVMEHTGIYGLPLAEYLYNQDVVVSVVNALKVKRFIQMHMVKSKTDKSDAHMICEYGKSQSPDPWEPSSPHIQEIKQINVVLKGYLKQKTANINRLKLLEQAPVKNRLAIVSLKRQSRQLLKEINLLEEEMEAIVKEYYSEMYENLQTVPGLGKKTIVVLLAVTGGFENFESPRQVISWLGLSPRVFESGTSVRGKSRICKMGGSYLRPLLFMCSFSAIKCNAGCRNLYERLVERGKPKKVALIAVCNKLIKQAFAIAKSGEMYDPGYYIAA